MNDFPSGKGLKLFVSYSRRDLVFADRLVDALKSRGFDVRIDQRDLPKLEDWRRELLHLIRQSDSVVFIVSSSSLRSSVVNWELEQVRHYGKRLAPVVIEDVSDFAVPADISKINYVPFLKSIQFEADADELAEALNTDIVWLREQTRIGEAAWWWQEHQESEDTLFRGKELAAADQWASRRPSSSPPITAIQRAFLDASHAADAHRASVEKRDTRLRTRRAALLAMLLVLLLTYAALSNRPFLRAKIAALIEFVYPAALSKEAERRLRPGDVFFECAMCPQMIVVPPGTFTMGSPSSELGRKPEEGPAHPVTISRAFAVSRFEITFEQWEECVAHGGCTYDPPNLAFGGSTRPVINIGWEDANQYAHWLHARTGKRYRLLSESEWEYAARGGTQTVYPWGDDLGVGKTNCGGCGSQWDNRMTAPVGGFSPNAFGLYDMIGNVWEWVEDCWHPNYEAAPADGNAWTTSCSDFGRRVIRGGSWDDVVDDVRSATRYAPGISARTRVNGIRVARSLD